MLFFSFRNTEAITCSSICSFNQFMFCFSSLKCSMPRVYLPTWWTTGEWSKFRYGHLFQSYLRNHLFFFYQSRNSAVYYEYNYNTITNLQLGFTLCSIDLFGLSCANQWYFLFACFIFETWSYHVTLTGLGTHRDSSNSASRVLEWKVYTTMTDPGQCVSYYGFIKVHVIWQKISSWIL